MSARVTSPVLPAFVNEEKKEGLLFRPRSRDDKRPASSAITANQARPRRTRQPHSAAAKVAARGLRKESANKTKGSSHGTTTGSNSPRDSIFSRTRSTWSTRGTGSTPSDYSSSKARSMQFGLEGEDEAEEVDALALRTNSASPLSVLQKGNSDPFFSYAIGIGAQENSCMTFYRDIILPSYNTGLKGEGGSMIMDVGMSCAIQQLTDSGGAYGFLARTSQTEAIATGRANVKTEALTYQGQSLKLLRQRLSVSDADLNCWQVHWHIYMLWGTETLALDKTAATIHGRMLRRLLELEPSFDFKYLMFVISSDMTYSSTFMVPPIFDYGRWVPDTFAPLFAMTAGEVDKVEKLPDLPLDVSIPSAGLKQILKDIRETQRIVTHCSTIDHFNPLLHAWTSARNSIQQGQLITVALGALEAVKVCDRKDMPTMYANAYLAFAALYWKTAAGELETILGVDIYNMQQALLRKLQHAITMAIAVQTPATQGKYNNAMLWVLFVGSQGERFHRSKSKTAIVSEDGDREDPVGWFNQTLGRMAKGMGIMTWSQLREVMKGFLYNDSHQPHGSLWFWKVLAGD